MKSLALLLALLPLAGQAQTIDPAPLSQSDVLSREIGFGIGSSVLDAQGRGPWTAGSFSVLSVNPDGQQSSDLQRRNAALGYGFGDSGLSAFLGYGQGAAGLADDRQEARIRSYFLGLSYSGQAGSLSYGAVAYVGRSHNVIDSPAALTGTADHDGHITGLSLRAYTPLSDSLDLTLQGDALRHATKAFPITGYAGQTVAARETTATRLRAELGLPMQMQGWDLRPYAALSTQGGTQGALSVGGATGVKPADTLSGTTLGLGTQFKAPGGLMGRAEVTSDSEGHTGGTLGLNFRF